MMEILNILVPCVILGFFAFAIIFAGLLVAFSSANEGNRDYSRD